MHYVFEIVDKSGRKIHLSKERWAHIKMEHPHIIKPEEIEKVIVSPDKITDSDKDSNVKWCFLYNKLRKRYLKVSVKYLNGEGYVITAHFTTKIQ